MKIKRQKQARHLLNLYKNIFKFHEPYQILIDGTFAQALAKNMIMVHDQLPKYFNSAVQCCTTRCVLAELTLLGSQMHSAKIMAQRMQTRSCPHKNKPVPAVECLKTLIGDKNDQRYFIATQDPILTKHCRSIPGIPVLYVHQTIIILDKMSKVSSDIVKALTQGKLGVSQTDTASLTTMKKEADLLPQEENSKRKRKKKAKGPNPLSCKKRKLKK